MTLNRISDKNYIWNPETKEYDEVTGLEALYIEEWPVLIYEIYGRWEVACAFSGRLLAGTFPSYRIARDQIKGKLKARIYDRDTWLIERIRNRQITPAWELIIDENE